MHDNEKKNKEKCIQKYKSIPIKLTLICYAVPKFHWYVMGIFSMQTTFQQGLRMQKQCV